MKEQNTRITTKKPVANTAASRQEISNVSMPGEAADSRWEKAGISNDLIFSYVMQNKELFLSLVQRICPELQLTRIEDHVVQKTEKGTLDSRGVRFDVYSRIDGKCFDVEMQIRQEGDERRRTRYYQCMMDEREMHIGDPYSDLPDSYIIMIGSFDIFGQGRHIYQFRNVDMTDRELELGDGTTKIFLNSKGTKDDVPKELKNFLELVNGLAPADDFCREVSREVERAKQNMELRRQYMDLQDKLRHERSRAKAEGLQEGHEKGLQEGHEKGLQEGMVQGRAEGALEGTIRTLAVLVKDGTLPLARAAQLANLNEAEFIAAMKQLS